MEITPGMFPNNSFAAEVVAVHRSGSEKTSQERLLIAAAKQKILDILGRDKLRRSLEVREIHTSVGHFIRRGPYPQWNGEDIARKALVFLADPEAIGGPKIEFAESIGSFRLKTHS